MGSGNFDVIIVGAGCAGLTAAIGLARANFAVAVLEAAPFPGAENWSGCVYFCENLAHPDILGPEGVEALAWERRLVERGFFATDGHGLLGMTYRDPEAFRHCYTVLRPIYDHHLAQVALRQGVGLLNSTTAESLIREDGKVIGVCTNRGALYADLVFLAEGDASHLVTREGYERFPDPRQTPKFLQGIKQVIEFPPGEIEKRFGMGAEEGAAYEMLLRNGTLRGQRVHLNMGGFVYTNRQSLSVGLVLPADNLHEHFEGDPNLLTEWFLNLPSLQHWFQGGKQTVFGAKLIRGGGARDIPTLIDNGLAVGGAASAIGIDFPYPNFTGPATAMGLLITQAAQRIREAGGHFNKENLQRHYLEPLQQTHYWQDVEFLRRWPRYVKTTTTFFGDNIDFTLQSAYLWTRSKQGLLRRWLAWMRLLLRFSVSGQWSAMREDSRQLELALRVQEVVPRPSVWRLLLDGSLNAVRDFLGRPRANLPASGKVQLHYRLGSGKEPGGMVPKLWRGWFRRFAPVLANAARLVYSNNNVPLSRKLPLAVNLLVRQVNLFDLFGAALMGAATGISGLVILTWGKAEKKLLPETAARSKTGDVAEAEISYVAAAQQAGDMTPLLDANIKTWEARLGQLEYSKAEHSHIHVLWPQSLPDKNKITEEGLWHVCPAHVYESRTNPNGQLQVVVNFENCIKCETCWRVSGKVDWGRDGDQQFIYPVQSPAVDKLLQEMNAAGTALPISPRQVDFWEKRRAGLTSANGENAEPVFQELARLSFKLEHKLLELEQAIAEEPRTIDSARAEYLNLLARYARQLTEEMSELVKSQKMKNDISSNSLLKEVQKIVREAHTLAEQSLRHTWDHRFSWAAAAGRQLRFHQLRGLQSLAGKQYPDATPQAAGWLRAETAEEEWGATRNDWKKRLDDQLAASLWKDLDHGKSLSPEQDRLLRDLTADIPALDLDNLAGTLHPPMRKFLLAELGRRDPSLALHVAAHLWARDLAALANSDELTDIIEKWRSGDEWACFAALPHAGESVGEALFIPAAHSHRVLILHGDRLLVAASSGLELQALPTLGLRGAGICRLVLTDSFTPQLSIPVNSSAILQAWTILSAADLTSIAFGMSDILCRRAIEHATSRVQFPGLFQDEDARDTIGKFGAIKKMVAEIAARRYLMETLDYCLAPTDLQEATASRACLIKALVAEALGTAPGSVSYNAGQIFGGTGYSEDDILSKYYRDAAAWRFLGPDNAAIYLERGWNLVANWAEQEDSLSCLEDEAQLFEEVVQRKALQAELDELRVLRSRLRQRVGEWLEHFPSGADQEREIYQAEFCEALGRQDAFFLAGKALLLRTHARLEDGFTSEIETALLRSWLEIAALSLGEFEGVVQRQASIIAGEDRPVVDPGSGPPVTVYEEFLAAPLSYTSGDFLVQPANLISPRYVPEMVEADPNLAQADRHIRTELEKHFGGLREGLVYERYIEKQHRPDESDLDFLRQQGFFRMLIPKELGGEGSSKAAYYLLTTNSHRLADGAVSLTIQVNSSLGTTPVLVARDKDLPRAQAQPPDEEFAEEIGRRLQACDLFLRWVASGQISAFALTEPSAGSDTARVATRARLRSVPVAADANGTFLFVPYGAKAQCRLLEAARLEFHADKHNFGEIRPFYRWSETESAPICFDEYDYETDDPHKLRYFRKGNQKVYFTDIAQLRQRDGKLWYDYWELNGAKMWITNGRMCGIMCLYAKTAEGVTGFIVDRHDPGLIVGKDEEKMGQCGSPTNELSLQAVRVPRENIIGLEGRGQANALETLNVGRAGLAMSAMCQMQPIIEWSRAFAQEDRRNGEPLPAWVRWRLERMEEDRFVAEALAHDIIGKFEHKQTKSIRLESAIAKMLASELLHRLIERAEEIHGLAGQTQLHLVEKRKRDARVLNIYEGTNEIQRFFILRDLAGEVARRWSQTSTALPSSYLGREALELEHLKSKLREITEAALQFLGQQLWQNPNLQANCFLLAEAVAWIGAADSTLGRLAWLFRRDSEDEEAAPSLEAELGKRAFQSCAAEVRDRLKRFEDELTHLRRGFYAAEVRAASLLFQRTGESAPAPFPASEINRPFSILVVMETPVPGLPNPVVVNGQFQEPYLVFREADRAALEMALRLRDSAGAGCSVQVVLVGPTLVSQHLREILSLGVECVRLLAAPAGAIPPDRAAAALADFLTKEPCFDLILGGGETSSAEEGLLAPLLAEALGVPFAGSASQVAVRASEANAEALLVTDQGRRVRPLPVCAALQPGLVLRKFSTTGYLQNLHRSVELISWPEKITLPPAAFFRRELGAKPRETARGTETLLPLEAGQMVLRTLGLDGRQAVRRGKAKPVVPMPSAEVSEPFFARAAEPLVLAVLATNAEGKLRPSAENTIRAAHFIAQFTGDRAGVLLLVPRQENLQQACLTELSDLTSLPVTLLPVGLDGSDEMLCKVLAQCWKQARPHVRAVVGEPWAESAFITLAAGVLSSQRVFARVAEVDRQQGNLTLDTSRLADRVRCQYLLNRHEGDVWWITLTEEAVISALSSADAGQPEFIERWQPALETFYGRDDIQRLLADLKHETGLLRLSDAEFIIDVGFGVGNRDGYEAVIVPLEHALRELGVRSLMIGGSRKVTEELHLLPEDRQIGQSGVSVNPRLLLAIGISGAPQHLNYIGTRTTIIAFNRDPDAPLMTLNQRQPQPRVYPVLGDLFETVPAFLEGLRREPISPTAAIPRHDVTMPQ